MTRSKLREHIFKMLFQSEFYPEEEMPAQVLLYLDSMEELSSEEERSYLQEKTDAIVEMLPALDQQLSTSTTGWKLNRMGKAELTILRLAAYEILYDDQIPQGVAIDQAVELARKFGGEQSSAFVNGVLAKFVRAER